MTASILRGLLAERPSLARLNGRLWLTELPYENLGAPDSAPPVDPSRTPVFITARFRTGSTLLWNLFRHLPGCTAYYEPFNERRWFDPASRGSHTDVSHKHVEEYWREYDGLEELGRYYKEDWIDKNLLMGPEFWAPDMRRYVEILIERAKGRPVLQFNRIDFRLPWFRHNFPNAKIVHLYRHPRNQWCSTLKDPARYPRDATAKEFRGKDGYYLWRWANDLQYHFPFLEDSLSRHAYEMFYLVWRLSYLYGITYAGYSLCFERLTSEPSSELVKLLRFLEFDESHVQSLYQLVDKPRTDQWQKYADEGWFREREVRCETAIRDFFAGGKACAES